MTPSLVFIFELTVLPLIFMICMAFTNYSKIDNHLVLFDWGVLISFRAEKGSYVSTFLPQSYTLDNYVKLFTDTTLLNFPKMFGNTLFIAIFFYILCVGSIVLSFKTEV